MGIKEVTMLSISRLSKTYSGGVKALDNLDLEVGVGMFGLLGPNGAGKSTLMRTIAGLQQPDAGQILFDGVDIVKHPVAIRRQLGYLPQEFGVYPNISALDLLDHLAVLKGLGDKRRRRVQVDALLEQTNLQDVRKKPVSSFSGGMRRRFGIAQALLGNPRLVIVDEPTAGLDPGERNRFYNFLGDIGRDRVVLLSTHIVEDVHHLCSRAAILFQGRICSQGAPGELVAELEGNVWRGVYDQTPPEAQAWTLLSQRLEAGKPTYRVLADSRPGPRFSPASPNLEDVYFAALLKQGARDAA